MQIDLNAIEIKIKLIEKESALKAVISLDFGDFVVKGFRVQESKFPNARGDNLWLVPPSYPAGGKYHPIFYVPDKELWEALANKIWDVYYKEVKLEDEGPMYT